MTAQNLSLCLSVECRIHLTSTLFCFLCEITYIDGTDTPDTPHILEVDEESLETLRIPDEF